MRTSLSLLSRSVLETNYLSESKVMPIFRKKVLSTEGASGGSAEIAYPSYPRWSTVAIERKEEFDCLEKVFFLVDGF